MGIELHVYNCLFDLILPSCAAQGFQQPQATLSSAPITTSQVTQAPQTITPPPAQDYSQFTGGTIPQSQQESIQLLSENGQVDAMLTDHSGMQGLDRKCGGGAIAEVEH